MSNDQRKQRPLSQWLKSESALQAAGAAGNLGAGFGRDVANLQEGLGSYDRQCRGC